MKLTTKQEQLIDDLRKYLMELNEAKSSNTEFNFIDLNEIKSEEDEAIKQYNEIKLHNQTMHENQMHFMFELMDKLDADFKKAGLNLRCGCNKNEALKFKTPQPIYVEGIDENGKRLNGDLIWIEAKPKHEIHYFKGRSIYKIIRYRYGRIHDYKDIYDTVEGYLNSSKVKEEFAIMYHKLRNK